MAGTIPGAGITTPLTLTTADNLDTLSLVSTDADANQGPVLNFKRDSSSPADDDILGQLTFTGENDASEAIEFVRIRAGMVDVTDGTEDSRYNITTYTGGSQYGRLNIEAGETVFNENSADVDFRVESDGSTHQLFVDAGNGRVGVGTSSPDYTLHVRSTGSPSNDTFIDIEGNSTDANVGIQFTDSGGTLNGRISYDTDDDNLQFWTGGSNERMRLLDTGLKIGTTSGSGGLFVDLDRSGDYIIRAYNSNNSNPTGIFNYYSGAAPDSSGGNQFLRCQDTGAVRLDIRGDGDVLNHDNAYGSTSDERIKQDIRDSNSQWDDIKAIKVRNYKKKDDVRQYGDKAWEQIGVIAQELETVSPKLIRHNDPSSADILSDSSFGTIYADGDSIPKDKEIGDVKEIKEQVKSVNYSVLHIKAIKALQEAMAKIEALETSNTDLKNRVTALEG